MEHKNPRVESIIQSIEEYANDAYMDAYNHGYDEAKEETELLIDGAYEEGKDTGFDMGWDEAINRIITKVLDQKSGLVYTPKNKEDLTNMIEAYNDKGIMCVMMFQNWLVEYLQGMKDGTN